MTEGIQMTAWLVAGLKDSGFTTEQIQALGAAMANSGVDPFAQSYAHGMVRAYSEFGPDGVKMQILYLLMNLSKWKGEEARESKKVLRAIK